MATQLGYLWTNLTKVLAIEFDSHPDDNLYEPFTKTHISVQQSLYDHSLAFTDKISFDETLVHHVVIKYYTNTYLVFIDGQLILNLNISSSEIFPSSVFTLNVNCKPGYAYDGVTCTDVNECLQQEPICGRGDKVCINTVGSFECSCRKGFNLNPNTMMCESLRKAHSLVGIAVVVVISSALIGFAVMVLRIQMMDSFPELPFEVSWSFINAKRDILSRKWRRKGEVGPVAYFNEFEANSVEFGRVNRLTREKLFCDVNLSKIWGVYNATQLNAFYHTYTNRNRPIRQWPPPAAAEDSYSRERYWVDEAFQNRVKQFDFNREGIVSILPVLLHATTLSQAFKLCDSGLSSYLVSGWYGEGIYVTSYTSHALQSIRAGSGDAALVMAYVIPGDTYPLVEHPNTPDSGIAQDLKAAYESHYVRVHPSLRYPVTDDYTRSVDELVIKNESHIVPAFILQIADSELTFNQYSDVETVDDYISQEEDEEDVGYMDGWMDEDNNRQALLLDPQDENQQRHLEEEGEGVVLSL